MCLAIVRPALEVEPGGEVELRNVHTIGLLVLVR